jgi:proline dehydrogenase
MLDLTNTEIAFSSKSNAELRKAAWLFGMMNKPWLVKITSTIGLYAVEWDLPFAETAVKETIFYQFCGGTSLDETKRTVEKLYQSNTLTILDYGAEAKETEADFDRTRDEFIRAIQFGATTKSVPVVSIKISGMSRFELLEKIDAQQPLNAEEQAEFERVEARLDAVCLAAHQNGLAVFVDAEESWIQDTIDALTDKMMARYNKEKLAVYNTFQMYRHDRLQFLYDSFAKARAGNYLLGAKLVRGAYMEKERKRADEMEIPSPINTDKATTDTLYNQGIEFCVEHYEHIVSCCATHNAKSSLLQAQLIENKGIARNHPHLNFCQLYGMSDNLTFNLAKAGYNVAKYVPYGTVREVIPYLIRRAQENTSVQGDMSREYAQIVKEMERRKIAE